MALEQSAAFARQLLDCFSDFLARNVCLLPHVLRPSMTEALLRETNQR